MPVEPHRATISGEVRYALAACSSVECVYVKSLSI